MYKKKAVRDKRGRIVHEVRTQAKQGGDHGSAQPPHSFLLPSAHCCRTCNPRSFPPRAYSLIAAGLATQGSSARSNSNNFALR